MAVWPPQQPEMLTFTNCKINLGLNIVHRRPDGYHDIETCMLPVPWHDIVEITPSESGRTTLTVLGNSVDCLPEKNLVMKAFHAMARRYDLPPLDIVLRKIVPDGAGLGGGSSDASHTLSLINSTFGLGATDADLAEIASTIGADCAFFIYNRPMICKGIGDVMTDISLPLAAHTIVIAKPDGAGVSTREAYAGVTPAMPALPLEDVLALPPSQWQGKLTNDFEQSIFPKAPYISRLKNQMLDSGAIYASMSGSGSSVFGIFDDDKMADNAAKAVSHLPHFSFKM